MPLQTGGPNLLAPDGAADSSRGWSAAEPPDNKHKIIPALKGRRSLLRPVIEGKPGGLLIRNRHLVLDLVLRLADVVV